MSDSTPGSRTWQLILIPAVITLAITLLRLVGELEHWSQILFRSSAGGGGAIVGIAWLPFIFGPYFAVKLARNGSPAKSVGKTIVFAFLGVVFCFGGTILAEAPQVRFPGKVVVGIALLILGGLSILPFWPSLFKTLIAYAYAARIPVLIVMFFAMRGSWGTHYDAVPAGFPATMPFWTKFAILAIFPQLAFWVAYTITVGAFIGGIFAAIMVRKRQTASAAA